MRYAIGGKVATGISTRGSRKGHNLTEMGPKHFHGLHKTLNRRFESRGGTFLFRFAQLGYRTGR
jgi:hypothetical protein